MSHRPIIPMAALTGRPTKQQLTAWLDTYAGAGIDQFMIYGRSGLEIEYLSADWFEACRHIIEHASELGMAIWIYDEFNWPSGGAGGKVLATDPEFAARKLLVYRERPGDVAVEPIAGGRAFGRVVRSTDSHAHDVLNPDAMNCFIRLTHEQYAKHFSDYFGSTIKGFFTDEPSFAYGNAGEGDPRVALRLPWYAELETEYRRQAGRDFRTDLADHLEGKTPTRLWSTCSALVGARFRFAFTERISRWCEEHGLISTGHFTNEFSPPTAIAYSGDPMMVARSLTMPGIDEIFSHADVTNTEWLTLKTVEQAAAHCQNGAVAELFALGPCDQSLTRRRQMIWLAALHGVDHYVAAVSSLDARANRIKQEYYNPFTLDQPWFPALQELGDEATQAAGFARKPAVFPVAVRFPQTLTSEATMAGQQSGDDRLVGLLSCLARNQWPALLLPEDAAPPASCQVVLTLETDTVREEKRDLAFNCLAELSTWLDRHIQRQVEVVDSSGQRADNLLVKSFADGSAVVLSLDETCRGDLTLHIGNERVAFSLPSSGVFTFPVPQPIANGSTVDFPEGDLHYTLSGANTMRLAFNEDGVVELELLDDLSGLHIVTRRYGDRVTLELNGKMLEIKLPCQSLPSGFNPLYAESAPLDLSRGTHRLRLLNPAADYPFLPAAFIVGAFVANRSGGGLKRLPARLDPSSCFQNELRGYTGFVDFAATLDCRGTESIRFNQLDMMSELFVDGHSLGRQPWEPFTWRLPEQFRQSTMNVRLRIATSIGPLFGEPPASFRRKYSSGHWFNPLSLWPARGNWT
jgi:hypothetical protein